MDVPLPQAFSVALSRLRSSVNIAAWLFGIAAVVQAVVWSLAAWTDMRMLPEEAGSKAPLVVQAETPPTPADGGAAAINVLEMEAEKKAAKAGAQAAAQINAVAAQPAPPEVNVARDNMFRLFSSIALGLGLIGCVCLLPLTGLGALMAAAGRVQGVDRTVNAFVISILLGLIALPVLGAASGLPFNGAFYAYDTMIRDVNASPEMSVMSPFVLQYLGLPLVCIVGAAAAGLQFSAGVEAGIIHHADYRIDPKLDAEASNIKPTSLHGGRNVSLLKRTLGGGDSSDETPKVGGHPAAAPAATPEPYEPDEPDEAPVGRPAVGAARDKGGVIPMKPRLDTDPGDAPKRII